MEATRDSPEALPFAEAVTLHLSHPPGGAGGAEAEMDAAARVLRLLAAAGAAEWLADDPPLLASVFQNIDLLVAHGFRDTDAVALRVMEALERADPSP